MTLLAFDDEDGARGFRLAGVNAVACRTGEDVGRAVAQIGPLRSDIAVVVVSPRVYALAPAAFDGLDAPAGWPILVVLPESEAIQVS